MSKEIVKYHNDMNKVNLGSFSTKELDLFFSICFKLKEIGTNEIKISFNDIKFLIGEENNPKRVKNHVDNLNKKLAQLNYQFEISPNIFERFVLFTNFTSNYNDNTLTIKINDKFGYLLNNLIGNFTKFELEQFVRLKSTYSKNMFKLLKQWESKKEREFKIEEFRDLLSIPKKYRMSIIDIKVLAPIMEELPQYFVNLKVEKIKIGRSISKIKFSWENRKIEKLKESEIIDIIEISDKLNKAIEKAKKNRFIYKLLQIESIEKLLKIFNENDLIKGLNWAYKEIKQDVNSLDYLIKTIRTGIEKKEKKLIVKKILDPVKNENKVSEMELEKPLAEEIKIVADKIKVTKQEYEGLYEKYLKENKIGNNKVTRLAYENSTKKKYEIINREDLLNIIRISEIEANILYQAYMIEHGVTSIEKWKKIIEGKYEIIPDVKTNIPLKIFKNELEEDDLENRNLEMDFMSTESKKDEDGELILSYKFSVNLMDLNIKPEDLLDKNGRELKGATLISRVERLKNLKK